MEKQTPFFIIKEDLLRNNIDSFRNALSLFWNNSQIAYSVKTNSLPWILENMRENNIYAEVVSDEEYELALMCGFDDSKIIFNGPIKTDIYLEKAFLGKAIINIDSEHELEYICNNKPSIDNNLGVRINVDSSIFDENDVGFHNDGFRFGFCEENGGLGRVISELELVYGHRNFGLHLHVNSVTRSPRVYKSLAEYARKIIKKYELNPSYIDVGGGFFGGVPGKATPDDYISAITECLKDCVDINNTKLYIEPGSAVIGSCVELHTSVIDVKDTINGRIVTTDGSRIHIDPLWIKDKYLYKCESNATPYKRQVICGYTCMDHDRLMILENKPELRVGDKIIYERVGNYTMTFGGPFIRYFPDVYVEKNGGLHLVRKRMTVEDYYNIESC